MKTKTTLILFYSIFGILQIAIGQEPDSLIFKAIDSSLIAGIDTTIINNDSTLIVDEKQPIIQQLDSLKIIYQEKKSELKTLGMLIDSLYLIINKVDSLDSDSNKHDKKQIDDDVEWLIKDFEFQFTATDLYIYRDSLFIKIRLVNLKNQDINIFGRIVSVEGNTKKGLIPIVYRDLVSNDDQEIIVKTKLDNNRLKINDSGILQVFLSLRFLNNQEYPGNYSPFNKYEWDDMRRKKYIPYRVQ